MSAIDRLMKQITHAAAPQAVHQHRHLHGADMDPEKYQSILTSRRNRIERNRLKQRTDTVSLWALESHGFESESVRRDNEWMQKLWNRNR